MAKRIISVPQGALFTKKPGEADPIKGTEVDTGDTPDFDFHHRRVMRPYD